MYGLGLLACMGLTAFLAHREHGDVKVMQVLLGAVIYSAIRFVLIGSAR